MKKYLLILASLAVAAAAVAVDIDTMQPVHNPLQAPRVERPVVAAQAVATRLPARARRHERDGEPLQADFTVQGAGQSRTVWTENFDQGMGAWVVTPDENNAIEWSLKKTTGTGKAFAEIDPADVQSLSVSGPYQVYKRGISMITSGVVEVGAHSTFNGYVYYSQNMNDYAVLTLQVALATAGDNAWTDVWNSTLETGDAGSRWHKIAADLSAYAGRQVKFRWVYGPGTSDSFKTGGYMADFVIDGLSIDEAASVQSITVKTGDEVSYVDLSTGNPVSWQWTLDGAMPATSTEQCPSVRYTREGVYDVVLTVTDAAGHTSTVKRASMVTVKGEAPVARIIPPATFRYYETHLPMVAPLVPVQYRDGSSGYPSQWQWRFGGATPATSAESDPWVSYDFMHQQDVSLSVANAHGTSADSLSVSAEYEGYINNLLPTDVPATFSLDGEGTFPGDNKMGITEYAEHFSKPSRPAMVYGALVYFVTASASSVADQIANVGVHLYTADHGLPGKKLDSAWWRVFELETGSSTKLTGTWFEFTPKVVDDDFFIVVDGIPEHNDSVDVSFAMAKLRESGNTAYFKNAQGWRPVTGYFSADKGHTSYYIFPLIAHSAITLLPVGTSEIHVPAAAGTVDQQLFSLFGYKTPVESDASWCTVEGKPNGLTLDTLHIAYGQLPQGVSQRVATLKFTDGMDTIQLRVVQQATGLKGDVNRDGLVNVGDVTELINMILGQRDVDAAVADLDGNGQVNVTDVTALVSLIVQQP